MKALEKKKECLKNNFSWWQAAIYPVKHIAAISMESITVIENGASQMNSLVLVRSHLRRIIKQLVLLKMLKSPNRRIILLCELAHKYQKTLALEGPLSSIPSTSGVCIRSEDFLRPEAVVVPEPVVTVEEMSIDKEAEINPSPETSLKVPPPEMSEALSLKGLPQRFHMPAPRVLCRPSPLRWSKPPCTRSCSETLEHVVTIRYSNYRKSYPHLGHLD